MPDFVQVTIADT